MNYEEEVRLGFEKAKAEKDIWLMNFYGSSLRHIKKVKQECKQLSDQRMHKYEEIKKNVEIYAEAKYLKSKAISNIGKSNTKIDLVWVIGIFLLVLAYFWLISTLCQ